MNNEKFKILSKEISLKKYDEHLPCHSTYLHNYINQWADYRDYYIDNYPHCGNDEVKKIFISELLKRKKQLYSDHSISELKDLVNIAENRPMVVELFKEFFEKIIEEHGEYEITNYMCEDDHTVDMYHFLFEKIQEIEKEEIEIEDKKWEKNRIIMKFIEEKKFFERPMNVYMYLEIRKLEKEKEKENENTNQNKE